jgi:hypothetical protein
MRDPLRAALIPILIFATGAALPAQTPPGLAAERAAFADWLAHAPLSPLAAVSAAPLDRSGVSVEMGGGRTARVVERDETVWIEGDGAARPIARNRPVRLGTTTLLVTGEPPRSRVTLFQAARPATTPAYWSYDPGLVFTGTLTPPTRPASERVLTPDGVEVEATHAGTVALDVRGIVRLRVMRLPDPGSGESSLEVYFRDATSGVGSYPAGRFVSLEPLPDGRYRLDFNRARNPFCAYNAAYPCPAPWPGNTIAAPIRAGERYEGHS